MKKVFLIFLLLVLPLQTLAAAERAFAHALGNGGNGAHGFALKHFIEHSNHILHHHDHDDRGDDDDDHSTVHEDNSSGSVKHALDFDQSSNFHAVIPATAALPRFHIIALRPECPMHAPVDCPKRSLFRPPRVSA
jgi:hypothetical protein